MRRSGARHARKSRGRNYCKRSRAPWWRGPVKDLLAFILCCALALGLILLSGWLHWNGGW